MKRSYGEACKFQQGQKLYFDNGMYFGVVTKILKSVCHITDIGGVKKTYQNTLVNKFKTSDSEKTT